MLIMKVFVISPLQGAESTIYVALTKSLFADAEIEVEGDRSICKSLVYTVHVGTSIL